jgi:hypothetical protein
MRRSVASVFLVCLMFKCVKATSARDGKGEKVAYVVRWEPELENVINPKRNKGTVNQRVSPVCDRWTHQPGESMDAR